MDLDRRSFMRQAAMAAATAAALRPGGRGEAMALSILDEQSGVTWRETRFRFSEFDDPFVTTGAGFQFYHSLTTDDRAQIWFRPWGPPPEVPDDEYPLWLCTGRVIEHWHTGTMTGRIPQLQRAMPGACVELNPNDARALGIRTGETVVLGSRRGSLEWPAWIGGRGEPPEGSVFVPYLRRERIDQHADARRVRPVLQAARLQEVRRENPRQEQARLVTRRPIQRATVVLAVLAVARTAAALADRPDPDEPSPARRLSSPAAIYRGPVGWQPLVVDPTAARSRTLAGRAANRAYDGAPPVMPHSRNFVRTRTCLSCHAPAGRPGLRTDHAQRTNCVQCHAVAASLDQTSPCFTGNATMLLPEAP